MLQKFSVPGWYSILKSNWLRNVSHLCLLLESLFWVNILVRLSWSVTTMKCLFLNRYSTNAIASMIATASWWCVGSVFCDGISLLLWNAAGLATSLLGPWPTHALVLVEHTSLHNHPISGIVSSIGFKTWYLSAARFTASKSESWRYVFCNSPFPVSSVSGTVIVGAWERNCDI